MEKARAGLDYPAVAVIFICHDGAGNILLAKRGPGARDERGKWEISGGGLELGEKVEETLERELKEEFSAKIRSKKFLGYRDSLYPRNGVPSHWITLDFLVEVDRDSVKIGEADKCDEIRWVKFGDWPEPMHVASMPTIERHKDVLSKL